MGANVFQPGERCGGCEIVRLLGAGGFAQVYEVLDEAGARRALKVLDTDAEARPKLRARLAQEGAALSMIEHVNVVRLYDAGFHQDRIYLLLELIRGVNLREATQAEGARPPHETLVRWILQAADGVGEGHRVGVVHRDLKPENILVASHDLVKVIDFGIAKFSSCGVKTTLAQRVGTALYMSPEQIQGRPQDPRMDVYALGLVLYEALSGAHPIVEGPATVFEICARQLNFRPPPLAIAAPHVPPELGAAVDRAIEKDPERRLPSMRALSDALHDGLRGLTRARSAAVERILAGPSPEAPTPVIDTPAGTSAARLGATQPVSGSAAWPLANSSSTRPIPGAETWSGAATGRVDAGASAEVATTDAITVPVKPARAPIHVEGARDDARAHASVDLGSIGLIVAATLLGASGGVWTMTLILAALHGPAKSVSAAPTPALESTARPPATPRSPATAASKP